MITPGWYVPPSTPYPDMLMYVLVGKWEYVSLFITPQQTIFNSSYNHIGRYRLHGMSSICLKEGVESSFSSH